MTWYSIIIYLPITRSYFCWFARATC